MYFEGENETAICVCEFVYLQCMLCKVILNLNIYPLWKRNMPIQRIHFEMCDLLCELQVFLCSSANDCWCIFVHLK